MASSAEEEIRQALHDWWVDMEPEARIVHELPMDGFSASGRADMGIILKDQIILLEIKSEKDKLTRLEKQFEAMLHRSHMFYVVCHEKWFEDDGQVKGQPWVRGYHERHFWKYPSPDTREYSWRHNPYWMHWLPVSAQSLLSYLWADELREVYSRHIGDVNVKSVPQWKLISDIEYKLTGREVALSVCSALRKRDFKRASEKIF